MSFLKRIFALIYVIASILSIGFLVGLWLQWAPLLTVSEWLTEREAHYIVIGVLLGIACLGLFVILVWAIVSPRRSSQYLVQKESGIITVSKQSIESVARYVVAEHRGLKVVKAKLRIFGKRKPRIKAAITIDPGTYTQLEELGTELHSEISSAIEKLVGKPADYIEIHFRKGDSAKADYSLQTQKEAVTEQEPAQNV